MRISVVFMVILAILVSCDNSYNKNDEEIKIYLNLEKGIGYNLEMTVESDIDINIMGVDQKQEQLLTMKYSFDVEDIDKKGNLELNTRFDAISMNQSTGAFTIIYDSEEPDKNNNKLIAGIYDNMVGHEIWMKVTPEGKVLEVKGVSELHEKVLNSIDLTSVPRIKQTLESTLDMFGEDAIAEMMEKAFRIYPKDAVKIGDSWKQELEITKGFPFKLDNTMTLKDIREDTLVINVESVISTNEEAPLMEIAGAKMKFSMAGSQAGTMKVDRSTGWTIESVLMQKVKGEIVIDDPTNPGQEIRGPMTMISKITMKSIDD